jgi:8-oxo-dGTP pyrophosphatase MutT (NUDIX family)
MESSRRTELRALLDRLEPADSLEREHKTRVIALLDEARDAFDRAHFSPGHVTASAFVVDPSREQLLLILHGKLGRWLQPGGHIDAGDPSVVATARREVLEETGLDLRAAANSQLLDVDVHQIPARADTPAHEHFDVRFAFEAERTDARAGSDALGARWVSIAELLAGGPELPTDESVLRAVRKLRARLA